MSLQQFKNDLALSIYGMTTAEAKAKGICIQCKREPVFRTEVDIDEYNISALCSDCFDEITEEEE